MQEQTVVETTDADEALRPVYFLVHVPKCAGGTIERYLAEHLQHQRYVELANAPKFQRMFFRPHYSTRISNLRSDKVDVVTSHPLASSFRKHFGDRPVRESVLLRDPLGQLMSQYNQKYWGRRGQAGGMPPFETWVRTNPANPISTFLLYRYFEVPMTRILMMSDQDRLDFLSEMLSRFWFVGDYRHCDTLIERLASELGLGRKTSNKGIRAKASKIAEKETIAPWVSDMVRNESAVDYALHEQFRDRLWTPGSGQPVSLPSESSLVGRLGREASRGWFMATGSLNRPRSDAASP